MTTIEAVKILRRYDDWRTKLDCRSFDGTGLTSGLVSEAIDKICCFHGIFSPICNCKNCDYLSCDEFGVESCKLNKCIKEKK